jgi:hypothetical protein
MQSVTRLACAGRFLGVAAVLFTWTLACPSPSAAQGSQGQNAVYNNSQQGVVVSSPAFIDASMFIDPQHTNICAVLNKILDPTQGILPAAGAVIDARGLNTTNTSMICQASPWVNIAGPIPSTILLPAGTIYITKSWVLPNNTRVIGEGSINPGNVGTDGTYPGFFTPKGLAGWPSHPGVCLSFP